MPLGDIAGSILGGVVRIIAEVFVNVVLEVFIKGPGYLILKRVLLKNREEVDPDSVWVFLVGALFWLIIGVAGYWLYKKW